jgi:hypothetical protein
VLGGERVLEGSGTVAVLELERRELSRRDVATVPSIRLVGERIRDAANRELAGVPVVAAGDDPREVAGAGSTVRGVGVPVIVDRLGAPTPNPFNPTTTLPFSIAEPGVVTIRIFDATGRMIHELWNGMTPAGEGEVIWDGRSTNGVPVPSGMYFAELHAGRFRAVQKLVLLK